MKIALQAPHPEECGLAVFSSLLGSTDALAC